MAPLGRSEKPIAFARKTIEPLEGSKPCHNSVITRIGGVSGLYLYVFIQIQGYNTRSNTVYQSIFSAIWTVSKNNFWLLCKIRTLPDHPQKWLAPPQIADIMVTGEW